MKVLWGDYNSMGTNPASVNMLTGDIVLNMNVFPYLDRFTQKFIIEHELAHFNQQTDCEELADKIALKKLYKTEYQSLKKSVRALNGFLSDGNKRIGKIYYECLNLDKMNSNRLLHNRTRVFPNFMLAADGGESETGGGGVTDTPPERIRRSRFGDDISGKRFVNVGNLVFTTGELLIAGLLLLVYFAAKKK